MSVWKETNGLPGLQHNEEFACGAAADEPIPAHGTLPSWSSDEILRDPVAFVHKWLP